ncbi:MAG: hypothetical protein VX519_06150 [Myxococcota bacterium]|nr:hypothetical protein [Myxococcota bacterium]
MESRAEELLEQLRSWLEASPYTTSEFAKVVGEDAKTVRAVLSQRSALTVDQWFAWTRALGVEPAEALNSEGNEPEGGGPRLVRIDAKESPGLDPYGMPAEQAVRLGFSLGIDFLFVADTPQLSDSGVPQDVLATFPDSMVIKLDSAYHGHNSPRFSEEGVLLSLSFKGVSDCFFSWDSILQVIFHVGTPAKPDETDEEPSPGPGLRLVK